MNTTGQPIAWCIADQETTEIVELFLQSIRKRSPMSAVSVLMTDDGIRYSIIMDVYYKLLFFPLQTTLVGMQQLMYLDPHSGIYSVIGMYTGMSSANCSS